ncbi:MAG: NAD(P)H-dependent oxidoreductase [Desulfobacterales bacterium]|nr:NAD(P)H-dependent oxidoreductase [Desulfobacterales bacterium]
MKTLIVHAHPEPRSFNAAMTATAVAYFEEAGHDVQISDLYAMAFDPVSDRRNFKSVHDPDYFKQQAEEQHASKVDGFAPDIRREIEKLEWCESLILQFPLWWFGLPAILKGWVDRVMVMGRIYGGGRWYDSGRFAGKRAMLALTTGGPQNIYRPDGLNGDIHQILFPINHGILRFTGFDVLPPFIAWGPAHVDEATRQGYLAAYRRRLATWAQTAPIAYPSLAEYDPQTYRRQ